MRKLFTVAAAALLAGCTSTGQLTPAAQTFLKNVVTASCQVDQAIPGLVAAGGQITAMVAPQYADEVALATNVERLAHPAVVAACNAAATAMAASTPVAATVAAVPVAVTVTQTTTTTP